MWLVEPPVAWRPTRPFDDRLLVDDVADRGIVVAHRRHRQGALGRLLGQGIAQRRAGIDEAGTGQMQAHDFHQHLVGVGGAVEGTGAGRVVGLGLRLEQFGRGRPCPRNRAGAPATSRRWRAGRHRPRRHEHGRQMPEGQRPDQEARHDLVADAEKHGGVEHVVAQGDRRRHGDNVAAEQRQIHARLALVTPSHIAGTPPATCAVAPI